MRSCEHEGCCLYRGKGIVEVDPTGRFERGDVSHLSRKILSLLLEQSRAWFPLQISQMTPLDIQPFRDVLQAFDTLEEVINYLDSLYLPSRTSWIRTVHKPGHPAFRIPASIAAHPPPCKPVE